MRWNLATATLCALIAFTSAIGGAAITGGSAVTLSAVSSTAGSSPANENVSGFSSCAVTIDGSTSPAFSGTLVVEGSSGGSTQPLAAYGPSPSSAALTSLTASGLYQISVVGFRTIDVRLTAKSSGTAAVSIACTTSEYVPVSYPAISFLGPTSYTFTAAAQTTTTIRGVSAYLFAITPTSSGSAGLTCYDNASAGSGNIIGGFTAAQAAQPFVRLEFYVHATNGITCVGTASSPSYVTTWL